MKDTTHLETLDGSCKFWEIEINDKTTTISYAKKRKKTIYFNIIIYLLFFVFVYSNIFKAKEK